jgi:cytochrome P450 family 110
MSLPPGPDQPGWIQAQSWIENPVDFWRDCAAQFGETFTVQLGSLGSIVLFSHPSAVRQIFQLPVESYECRHYNEQYKYVMGEQSLLLSDGPRHRSRRRLLMPPLHRQTSPEFLRLIQRLTEQAVNDWPMGSPFSMRQSSHILSLQFMLVVLFGDIESDPCRQIVALFRDEILQDLGTWSPWRRFGHLKPRFRELISREIHERRTHPASDRADLVSVLSHARDENGSLYEDDEIHDHVFTMLTAGVDPTAIALSWALYWVCEVPEVKEKVIREIKSLGTRPDPEQVAELPYLSVVCQEALRMYPVVPTPSGRKLTTRVEIMGHTYDPGTTLLPCTFLVHHRPELYDEPDRFRPERFLERRYGPHEYLPFGGGNRTCIGATLATLEIKIALATILGCRKLEPAHLGPVRPVRHGTLLTPSEAMRMIVTGLASQTDDRDPVEPS